MKVILDYGHGGKSPGAVSNGIMEKDLNRKIGEFLKSELEARGIEVYLTRRNDETVELNTRIAEINRIKADYVVSVHHNAGGGQGAEIIHSIKGGKGEILAQNIGTYLSKIQRVRRIYSKRNSSGDGDYFGIIREVKLPAVIIELGFVDNVDDFKKINDEVFQKEAAILIAEGICKSIGIIFDKEGNSNNKIYRVQVGAFREFKNAEMLAKELKQKGYEAVIV